MNSVPGGLGGGVPSSELLAFLLLGIESDQRPEFIDPSSRDKIQRGFLHERLLYGGHVGRILLKSP